MNAKLTKGIISREDAQKLCPAYVDFIENHTLDDIVLNPFMWNYEKTDTHGYPTHGLKKGQRMLTYFDGLYVTVKISSITNPNHDADGPAVRVTNGEYSWRIDGDKYGITLPI